MESYNRNILIIDDKAHELNRDAAFQDLLERLGFTVEMQVTPESGLIVASHKYSVIFIDYQFGENAKHTGTSLCYAIRKKCPLSTIILLTAYGKENIGNFNHADWDGYFEKDFIGKKASELDDLMKNCLTKAITIRHTQKLPILNKIPHETKAINDKKNILDNLEQLYNNTPAAKMWDDTAVAKELGYNNRTALSLKFTCENEETNSLKKEALIFRHILLNNPTSWQQARKHYKPLKRLAEFFFGEEL